MAEELHPDRGIATLLEELVPAGDEDQAWADLTVRFAHDRRRRTFRRAAAVAASIVLVVVVVGVGLAARQPADQVLDVATTTPTSLPTPTPTAGDTASVAPTVVELSCADGVGSVSPSVIVAGPAGVTVAPFEGGSYVTFASQPDPRERSVGVGSGGPPPGEVADFWNEGVAAGAPPGSTVHDHIVPGTYSVVCGTPTTSSGSTDPVIGTVEVIDPGGYFRPDPDPGATPESCPASVQEEYESTDLSAVETVEWRFGDRATAVGYRDGRSFEVVGAGVGGWITILDGRAYVRLGVCEGRHPLPPGDGLAPGAPLRTEAQAFAWLDANLGIEQPHIAIPADATITDRTAKLIRQDDGATEAHLVSNPPGFSGWLVRVGFVTSDGVVRVEVYRFSPDADPSSLTKLGYADNPPGRDWAAWFDDLPDHAP